MKNKNNKKTGIPHRRRHSFYYRLLTPLVKVFLKLKFKYKFKKAKTKDLPENYIVLSNHATDYDMLFVAMSFKRPMYFVASEHISRWKKTYRFVNYCFNPIMRYKGSVASSTVMEILRRTKKGANVCIFAEGVRSWDGANSPILPSTAKLVKSSGAGLVTYKLTGGYFAMPNWSNTKPRKGPIHGEPVNIYTKEQLASMTEEEVYNIITRDLYENAYETQKANPQKYTGKNLAHGLENLLFICPKCKSHDKLTTHGNTVACTECGFEFNYNEYGMLENSPYNTVYDFANWQKTEIEHDVKNNVSYSADNVIFSSIDKHIKTVLTTDTATMSNDSITCGEYSINMSDITDMAIYGKHGIVFSANGTYYEMFVPHGINAIKFLLYFDVYEKLK